MQKMKRLTLILALGILLLFIAGCNAEDEEPEDIMEIMNRCTEITITNVTEQADASAVANVQITMPDIAAIYNDLKLQGKTDSMTLEEIGDAIDQYAEQNEFLRTSSTTASVTKDGNEWILSSNDCVDEAISQMADELMTVMINNMGTIEIVGDEE